MAVVLIDWGADLEIPGGSIGTPLDNAIDGTPLDAASGSGTRRENVITWLRELGAGSSAPNSKPV